MRLPLSRGAEEFCRRPSGWGVHYGVHRARLDRVPPHPTGEPSQVARQERNKLTHAKIQAAKPSDKPYKLTDGGGLFLLVHPNGGRYWRLKYRWQRREQTLSIGVYPHVTLKAAREARDDAHRQIASGVSPGQAKRAQQEAQAETFQGVAAEWLEQQRSSLKADTLQLARARLEKWAYPHIGTRPIAEIEPPEVLRLLRRIEAQGRLDTAHRVRQRISQIFRYAIITHRAERDPTADLKGALATRPAMHHAAITDRREVGALLRAIDSYQGQPATRYALQLMALTFLRPGELRAGSWQEVDFKSATWRIPAERMKGGRRGGVDHNVPLAPQALKYLQELYAITGDRPFMFEATRRERPLSENTLRVALRTMGYTNEMMTPHGFRSTASTLLHEEGWPPEIIELQLAHTQRNQVAAAYNRSARLAERRRMMEAWADLLQWLRSQV